MKFDYEKELQVLFPAGDVRKNAERRYWVNVPSGELHDAVRTLRDKLGIVHLSTIVGEDLRDAFQNNYIFSGEVVVTLCVRIDREKAEVPSLAPIIDGAMVYEREIHDLLGIVPVGHPDLRRQILPEDWPDGVYPLRKDYVVAQGPADTEKKEEA
ncbi:MAG TPA: NADH-quinone oxidoreductase subunit C [Acidobacteriota bacterium]|nr:NADH-quinone oxidoreductase subunit C [Acidobacteriota bacterium]HNR39476.1 NADH-quinone oxidoreductase subunit C [Acidobacteriota bacterium]HNU02295.1 NADH-quinone oxidoreductase subunit C [Acidobacteriota bacterium]HPB27529.1 NADH-quinone oxidoreductase subunit C [Acidobacteriota bacterium]HQO26746.1 NADH-quinone oxidoreductase subunit C [Acidobacteriota bacterium]